MMHLLHWFNHMPPYKFDPSKNNPANVEYVLPTKVENDKELETYYLYLKHISSLGIGSITSSDLSIFYDLMKIPQRFSKDYLMNIFSLLSQAVSAECFEKKEDALECLEMIGNYRTEMDI